MLGFRYAKFDANTYLLMYRNGRVVREGQGLSALYFAPTTTLVAVPMGSSDIPFIFQELTQDFQTVTVQGLVTYRITQPKLLATQLNLTINPNGGYLTDDLQKLNQRLSNAAQTVVAGFLRQLPLKQAITAAPQAEELVQKGLETSPVLMGMGVAVSNVNVLAIRPTPEMERALEAQTREALQQDADQAIFARRNFAVEQERMIRESELQTEIAVEEKQRQIAEKQMEAAVQAQENERRLREMRTSADVAVEQQRQQLVELQAANERKLAETKAYALEAMLKPYANLDWRLVTALNSGNTDAQGQLALAFRELAGNVKEVGQLNVSPDLFQALQNTAPPRKPKRDEAQDYR